MEALPVSRKVNEVGFEHWSQLRAFRYIGRVYTLHCSITYSGANSYVIGSNWYSKWDFNEVSASYRAFEIFIFWDHSICNRLKLNFRIFLKIIWRFFIQFNIKCLKIECNIRWSDMKTIKDQSSIDIKILIRKNT